MSRSIYVYNRLPDPKPASVSAWAVGGGRDITRTLTPDGWLQLTNNATHADPFVFTRLSLPAGAWRFGAEMDAATTGYADNQLRFIHLNPVYEMRRAEWDGTAGRIVTPPNKLDADSNVELRLMVGPSAGDTVRVRHLCVMTDDDYQLMLASNVTWFDGNTVERST